MEPADIYKKIESHVTSLFNKESTPALHYHNLEHTKQVVLRTKEIAAHYNLTEKEMLVLYAAAWFHDVGYLFTNERQEHEEKSAAIMRSYLTDYVSNIEIIDAAEACILATKYPQNPKNLLEEIICDADMYHLGTKDFKQSNKRIRKERLEERGEVFSKVQWLKNALAFMEAHRFHTSYCKELLEERKKQNIARLKKELITREETEDRLITGPEIKPKNALMTKGIQTMLRLTSDNHLELSGMADGKANILISVNAIIISVILSVLVRRLEVDTHLTIPTIIFLAISVTTIVIAILATRPKISEGIFSDQDIINKKTNLLFFGNFHRASLEQYENAMRTMMGDSDYLYGSLIKDIYALGVVLARKYKLIRLAYNIFMIGIVVSVLAFGIAVYLNNLNSGATTPAGNSAAMPL